MVSYSTGIVSLPISDVFPEANTQRGKPSLFVVSDIGLLHLCPLMFLRFCAHHRSTFPASLPSRTPRASFALCAQLECHRFWAVLESESFFGCASSFSVYNVLHNALANLGIKPDIVNRDHFSLFPFVIICRSFTALTPQRLHISGGFFVSDCFFVVAASPSSSCVLRALLAASDR